MVASNGEVDAGFLACPVLKGSTVASFYLFNKSSERGFSTSKIKSWVFSSINQLQVQKIDSEDSQLIYIHQNPGWGRLNGQAVNDVCFVQWDFEEVSWSKRSMTCKIGDANSNVVSFSLNLLKTAKPDF